MTHRRGKATPKSIRSPPRPPDEKKMAEDIEKHRASIRNVDRNFNILRVIAAQDPQFRQLYLDTFLSVHCSRYVDNIVYDPSGHCLEERITGSVSSTVKMPSEHVAVLRAHKQFYRRQKSTVFVDADIFTRDYRAQIDEIAKWAYETARELRRP